jgi:hypothetical protein
MSETPLSEFIDLPGASGAIYRLRRWADGAAHPPIAGNFVFISRSAAGAFKVLLVGMTDDLSRCRDKVPKPAPGCTTLVFTRLNVSRSVRQAEHDDLVAHHQHAMVSRQPD